MIKNKYKFKYKCFSVCECVGMHLCIVDSRCGDPGQGAEPGVKLQTLWTLRGQALAGRGVCFLHTGRHREALQDLQLGLQASPGTEHLRVQHIKSLCSKWLDFYFLKYFLYIIEPLLVIGNQFLQKQLLEIFEALLPHHLIHTKLSWLCHKMLILPQSYS